MGRNRNPLKGRERPLVARFRGHEWVLVEALVYALIPLSTTRSVVWGCEKMIDRSTGGVYARLDQVYERLAMLDGGDKYVEQLRGSIGMKRVPLLLEPYDEQKGGQS